MAHVSMTAIAERAGVARQTVYNNFPDVESAMLGYVVGELDRTGDHMERMLADARDPERQIRVFATELIQRFARQDFQVSVQAAMSPAAIATIELATNRLRAMLTEIVVEGIETGQFATRIPAERAARLAFQMIVGCGHLALTGHEVTDLAGDTAEMIASAFVSR